MLRLPWLVFLSAFISNFLLIEISAGGDGERNICHFKEKVKNVALGKIAEQSTPFEHGGGQAEKAIDGNTNEQFLKGVGTCSHTLDIPGKDSNPWLRVDLGSTHLVQNVKLYPRTDKCCVDRYHDLEVRVGQHKEAGIDVPFLLNGICNAFEGEEYGHKKDFDFICPSCLFGRYVSIQITNYCKKCREPTKNTLMICELEVYGYKA